MHPSALSIMTDHNGGDCFEICPKLPRQHQSARILAHSRIGQAPLIKVSGDYYAQFQTCLGAITYIFLQNGDGFRLGPGALQSPFRWRFGLKDMDIVENAHKDPQL